MGCGTAVRNLLASSGGRRPTLLVFKEECRGGPPFNISSAGFFCDRNNLMPELAPFPVAQQWINVVLIWVGFGTLAGLLATVIFPQRRGVGPFATMVAGIVGSTLGLLGLSWLYPDRPLNPISPLGFLAATIGAFVLLVLYRLGSVLFKHEGDAGEA